MERLEDFRYTMTSCNHCGQCKWILAPKMSGWDFAEICPIHQRFGFDACSGQGLIHIAQELLDGTLKYEDGLVDLIYTCTTCGACDVNCKSIRDMEVLDTILALRAKCAEDGHVPAAHRETALNVASAHNIYGKPHDRRFEWLPRGHKARRGYRYRLFCRLFSRLRISGHRFEHDQNPESRRFVLQAARG